MYARVARWEGAEADLMRKAASDINERSADGPPPGVPAKGFLMLIDPEGGKTMSITLFETEEDRDTGHATLNEMSPPDDGFGQRGPIEMYEVAVDLKV
jgi:hypothetical protein